MNECSVVSTATLWECVHVMWCAHSRCSSPVESPYPYPITAAMEQVIRRREELRQLESWSDTEQWSSSDGEELVRATRSRVRSTRQHKATLPRRAKSGESLLTFSRAYYHICWLHIPVIFASLCLGSHYCLLFNYLYNAQLFILDDIFQLCDYFFLYCSTTIIVI